MSVKNKEVEKLRPELEQAIEEFKKNIQKIKTGRANSGLVEDVKVDYFGVRTPLLHLATINVPDAKTIEITPWDKNLLASVEKAVKESDLGLNPTNDGKVIRINMPAMTEERRNEMVKMLGHKTEEARIRVRKIRENFWDEAQEKEKEGEISEDEKYSIKESLQEIVDEYNQKIEEIEKKKEEEIKTV
ncbi:MAG: ribosome recycling factor [Candidatus Moranbacteria bacterium]|nr:ribosome recycling factor [Candidatus Moranbacteria bacterium]